MESFELFSQREDVPIVVANEQGVIVKVSKLFCSTFSWAEAELLDRPITALIPKHLHDAHHLGFSRFLMTGDKTILDQPLELELVTGAGEVILAEHYIISSEINGKRHFAARIQIRS